MPKKKGVKKKKKGADSDKVEGLDENDPGSLISVTQEDGTLDLSKEDKGGDKKKKKKGKKKKVSKSEKGLEKLEKLTEKLRNEKEFFHGFVKRMDKWLEINSPILVELFTKYDIQSDCCLNYDEFKSGLFDMNVPCNKIETHLLAKLLDRENSGDIDYTDIPKGLKYIRELEDIEQEAEENEQVLIIEDRTINHCKCCKMGIDEPYKVKNPKYILLELRMVTFDKTNNYSGHITELVHSHVSVKGLIEIIKERTKIYSSKIRIYVDSSWNKEAILNPEMTLKGLGYEGDTYDEPDELTLYYDFLIEFRKCPLLLSDHYFGKEKEKRGFEKDREREGKRAVKKVHQVPSRGTAKLTVN